MKKNKMKMLIIGGIVVVVIIVIAAVMIVYHPTGIQNTFLGGEVPSMP